VLMIGVLRLFRDPYAPMVCHGTRRPPGVSTVSLRYRRFRIRPALCSVAHEETTKRAKGKQRQTSLQASGESMPSQRRHALSHCLYSPGLSRLGCPGNGDVRTDKDEATHLVFRFPSEIVFHGKTPAGVS
jgi:hypothetical protein